VDSKALLSAYGIPVSRTQIAPSAAEAVKMAKELGYPVVMKIHSPDITHKCDGGGVKLNLEKDADVHMAFNDIMIGIRAHHSKTVIEGVTIQS
jgi:acetyltransferase